ncbi:MAG: GAF domain-containing sensor histidine kinase, partial [Chloroflexota bacterium]|nr:GAF domain-containing sensor histidine kinase [Chloroflexota bacterium]
IAVAFQPLRDRLQQTVNRLMYGERDEPYGVISRLGRRLEATLTPEEVLPTVVQIVRESLKLPYAAIELRQDGEYRVVASSGQSSNETLRLPLVYRGESVGQMVLAPRAGEDSFTPSDRRLLEDLARQAGIAVHAVRLTADLQRSRERLVTAREEERRRLRRDLHDGLGPTLANLFQRLDTASALVRSNPEGAVALIGDLKGRIKTTIGDIRRLVYALRPPALDEFGLVGAIREHAAQLNGSGGLSIAVEAPEPLPPLPAAVEVAAYRIVLEALANVVRHAQARICCIRMTVNDDALRLEVTDDGAGLPPGQQAGVGITSMRERAAELGGELRIEQGEAGGTRVWGRLPIGKE